MRSCRTTHPAIAAIGIVRCSVDTGHKAECRSGGTRRRWGYAGAGRTGIPCRADVPAAATMVAVRVRVFAGRSAQNLTGRTATPAGNATLIARADIAATATVVVVRSRVDTGTCAGYIIGPAQQLRVGCRRDRRRSVRVRCRYRCYCGNGAPAGTGTTAARSPGTADVPAPPAVAHIGLEVPADTAARGITSRA